MKMFWGSILEPYKRYYHVVKQSYHVSQAALDISTGDNAPCQVMVIKDGKNYLICTLQKTECIQVPLDLYFKTGECICFLCNGKSNVHLTGYVEPELEEMDKKVEEEGEKDVPAVAPAKNKSSDASASKKAKQKKEPAKEAAADSSDDDDAVDYAAHIQKFLAGIDHSEESDDESSIVNTSGEGDDSDEEKSDEEEEAEDEAEDEADYVNTFGLKKFKADSQQQKYDKKKPEKKEKKYISGRVNTEDIKVVSGSSDNHRKFVTKYKADSQQQKHDKKKPEKKEKKYISGRVFTEDFKVGSGPPAIPGNVVTVYYEGRLIQSNKMFIKCLEGPGFKFRLGVSDVIACLDVGIVGMKIGGKRRIICAANLIYNTSSMPPGIAPNDTLVFDVELKNVE